MGNELDQKLIQVVPSKRQIAFQQMEFYAFFTFGVNTFNDVEWGNGQESPEIFNPTQLDTKQWVKAIKDAGMTGAILICKHHDGFCLWPSKTTGQTVENSPFGRGGRDVVRELSNSLRAEGLKFGVYLSPFDMNAPCYGTDRYNDFFVEQLTELLTGYGEVFSVWFDGACDDRGKQTFDFDRYNKVIRALQPNACINVCGPDIRWCGNEAGHCRPSEWSVVAAETSSTDDIMESSQKSDDPANSFMKMNMCLQDLGSRDVLAKYDKFIWYPAEVNTSTRWGWYYHADQDDKVRSFEELIDIYYKSVGGNATFLLNIPPDKRGLLPDNDVKVLKQIGDYLRKTFQNNYALNSSLDNCMKYDNYDEYFMGPEPTAEISIELEKPEPVSHIVLKENITLSQRIEKFEIEAIVDGNPVTVYEGTVVGYKRIAKFDPVTAKTINIKILDSRVAPTLSFIGIY